MWHCPHCGAPQAETARCWVCRRSSTTCSTCVHFRRALAADLGYCAFDPRRRPLTGRELRGCWEGSAVPPEPPAPMPAPDHHRLRPGTAARSATRASASDEAAPRGFVPLELLGRIPPTDAAASEARPGVESEAPPPFVIIDPDVDWADRTSLFGEPEG